MRSLRYIYAAASLLAAALASEVPSSLSSDFDLETIGLQVNFEGNRFAGIADGTDVSLADAANQPVFALTDSSGVSTVIQFMIMMLDTTDTNNFVMHFLQTNFKADGEQTGISSTSKPLVPYQKPGSFGETGQKQYSFLLFQQTSNQVSGLPNAGSSFDVSNFISQNGLRNARAGLAINVNVDGSGTASGSSGNGNGNGNNGNGSGGNGNGNGNGSGGNGNGNGNGNNGGNDNNGNNGNSDSGNNGQTTTSSASASQSFTVTFESPIINSGTPTPTSAPAATASATGSSSSSGGQQGLGGSGSGSGDGSQGGQGLGGSGSGSGSGASTSTATVEATTAATGGSAGASASSTGSSQGSGGLSDSAGSKMVVGFGLSGSVVVGLVILGL